MFFPETRARINSMKNIRAPNGLWARATKHQAAANGMNRTQTHKNDAWTRRTNRKGTRQTGHDVSTEKERVKQERVKQNRNASNRTRRVKQKRGVA